jgi:sarcosine oxidase subunit gamma
MAETATPAETAKPADPETLRAARRSPASHLAPTFESGSVAGTVALKEIPFQTMVGIRVDRESDAGTRLASVTGGLPAACGEVSGSERATTLWLGPEEFLVIAPESAHDSLGGDLVRALVEALGDDPGQVVDLSANRTTFELSGIRARDVLEKGCSLDLHPRAFRTGTALATEIGNIPAMLLKTGEDSFRIFPRASFADFLGRWLLDCMREFASPEVP